MARVPDAEIERLKAEVPLGSLAEAAGVELARTGADLTWRCPFHDDDTPSLVISPGKNLWHCLQGGQKGHPGASLAWTSRPDETLAVEPGACGGCGAGLAGAPGRVASRVQVLDIPPAALTVTEYQMMCRTCGCGQVTTAAPPPGVTGGPVCYGPNVAAAATLLASTDVIGIERAADLMGALLGAPVSTGFVSRCLARLARR